MSTINSNWVALMNRSIIPISQMIIKKIGRTYLMIAVQMVPILILDFSFKTGMTFSAPKYHPNIMHWSAIKSNIPNLLTNPSTTPTI